MLMNYITNVFIDPQDASLNEFWMVEMNYAFYTTECHKTLNILPVSHRTSSVLFEPAPKSQLIIPSVQS